MAFVRIPKHRYFNYQPLYYDEKKERMKERYDKFGNKVEEPESKEDRYYPGKYLRGNMRQVVYDRRRSSMKPSLSRVLRIVLFLTAMVLVYIFADKIVYLFY